MTEHDNTNRGSVWKASGAAGKAEPGGQKYYAYLVGTGAKSPAPTSILVLQDPTTHSFYTAPMFRPKTNTPVIVSGRILVPEGTYLVCVFKNKSEHERSPWLDLSFKADEQQPGNADGEPPPEFTEDGDEIPFD